MRKGKGGTGDEEITEGSTFESNLPRSAQGDRTLREHLGVRSPAGTLGAPWAGRREANRGRGRVLEQDPRGWGFTSATTPRGRLGPSSETHRPRSGTPSEAPPPFHKARDRAKTGRSDNILVVDSPSVRRPHSPLRSYGPSREGGPGSCHSGGSTPTPASGRHSTTPPAPRSLPATRQSTSGVFGAGVWRLTVTGLGY